MSRVVKTETNSCPKSVPKHTSGGRAQDLENSPQGEHHHGGKRAYERETGNWLLRIILRSRSYALRGLWLKEKNNEGLAIQRTAAHAGGDGGMSDLHDGWFNALSYLLGVSAFVWGKQGLPWVCHEWGISITASSSELSRAEPGKFAMAAATSSWTAAERAHWALCRMSGWACRSVQRQRRKRRKRRAWKAIHTAPAGQGATNESGYHIS